MKTEEIIEGNKLIAEFCNYRYGMDRQNLYMVKTQMGDSVCEVDEMKFHASWDWLMPVVEKINSNREIAININSEETFLHGAGKIKRFDNDKNGCKILATYLSVIHFIKWHNSQSNA